MSTTKEYYSTVKRNEVLIHATTWIFFFLALMNLKSITFIGCLDRPVGSAADSWFQLKSWCHHLWVRALCWALHWQCGVCLGFSLSPSLSVSTPLMLSLSLKNKQTLKNHYVQWNNPDTKGQNIVWFHLHEIPGIGKFRNKVERKLTGMGEGNG